MTNIKHRVGMQVVAQAAAQSPCPRTQNAAVIMADDDWAIGMRQCVCDDIDTPQSIGLLNAKARQRYMTEASQEAIAVAAKRGLATKGKTLYCIFLGGTAAAKAILAAGITQVIFWEGALDGMSRSMRKRVDQGMEMLAGANVDIAAYSGTIECAVSHLRLEGTLISLSDPTGPRAAYSPFESN